MNKNPEVDAWLAKYDNPMKPVVAAIREAVLKSDRRVQETIKWQAPTFVYKGNIASFFPKAKQHATLMFHKGAEIPGRYEFLEGDGAVARSFKVRDLDDLKRKKKELREIVIAWCDLQDAR